MKKRTALLAVSLAAVVGLTTAACGGSSDDKGTADKPAAGAGKQAPEFTEEQKKYFLEFLPAGGYSVPTEKEKQDALAEAAAKVCQSDKSYTKEDLAKELSVSKEDASSIYGVAMVACTK